MRVHLTESHVLIFILYDREMRRYSSSIELQNLITGFIAHTHTSAIHFMHVTNKDCP